MAFFSKNKKADSSVTDTDDDSSKASNAGSSGNIPSLASMSANLEKLNAESFANKEIRASVNDRFAKISEEIGELRTMLRANEKTISSIEAKTERAVGLIDAVQPQTLLSVVNKTDFKIEALKAKVEANELIYSKVRDDIRDLRNKFAVFRNLEMVKELNEDSKNRFKDLRKTEFEIIKRSDRVESMFAEIEKSIKNSKDNAKIVVDLSDTLKKLLISVDKFKADLNLRASRDDLRKLQDSIDKSKTEIIDVVAKDIENYKRKALKEIEISVKQDEVRIVHQLIRDDLQKAGVNLGLIDAASAGKINLGKVDVVKLEALKSDSPRSGTNEYAVNMLLYMNMMLLVKNYGIDPVKISSFKDNPMAFTIIAYFALKLREKDASVLKKELLTIGFDDKKSEQILSNAKILGKML